MAISRPFTGNRFVLVLLAGILILLALIAAAFLFGGSNGTGPPVPAPLSRTRPVLSRLRLRAG